MTWLGLALAAVCCGLTLANAGSAWAAGPLTTYTATETVPVPPASTYTGSAGGDGWSVVLSNTQVFNVFHHDNILQVVCHNQSNALPCWSNANNTSGVDTITDPKTGANFASSGQPGLYLDQKTGKLYVYATEYVSQVDTGGVVVTSGVVCIDTTKGTTSSDPYCGFTPLSKSGEGAWNGSWSALTPPMLVGNHWYSFNYVDGAGAAGTENKLLCFDVSTDQKCNGQPFSIGNLGGTLDADNAPSQSDAAIGHELIIPTDVNNNNSTTSKLFCFDDSTHSPCSGSNWPVSINFAYVNSNGAPFPMLDKTGKIIGFCLPDSTDQCFGLDGSSKSTPPGMTSAIQGGSASWDGGALVLGPRVYVPAWNNVVYCYDASTQKSCTNFPKFLNGLDLLYTVNPDPQRPTCIWANSNDGNAQIQNFDAFTGGPCGKGAIRALASQFLVCTPGSNSYNSLQIVSPTRNQYSSGSVHFEDGDGNPIPGVSDRPIGSTGRVDLTGLSLNTSTGPPQFLITLNGTSGNPGAVELKLSWRAPYDASCLDDDASAIKPVTNHPHLQGLKPGVATGGVSGVHIRSATLHGQVDPHLSPTVYYFEYGPTAQYAFSTAMNNAGSGGLFVAHLRAIGGLQPNTIYHYRIVASDASGTTFGADRTFRTAHSRTLHVNPGSILPGERVHVFGNAGPCPVGSRVTLVSPAFSGKHRYLGDPAIHAKVMPGGWFSARTWIPSNRPAKVYLITAFCGGHIWG